MEVRPLLERLPRTSIDHLGPTTDGWEQLCWLMLDALKPADHDRVLPESALALYRPLAASTSVTDVDH